MKMLNSSYGFTLKNTNQNMTREIHSMLNETYQVNFESRRQQHPDVYQPLPLQVTYLRFYRQLRETRQDQAPYHPTAVLGYPGWFSPPTHAACLLHATQPSHLTQTVAVLSEVSAYLCLSVSPDKLQAVENLPQRRQNIQAKTTELQTETKKLYLLLFPSQVRCKGNLTQRPCLAPHYQ